MTLQFAIEMLVYGGAIPAAMAAAIAYMAWNLLAENVAERIAMAAGFSIAFVVGYVLLPDWAPLWPERHWQWFPQLAAMAMMIGPVGIARGVSAAERWLLWLLLAILAAYVLVPTWPGLLPSRQFYLPFLAGYFFALTAMLDPLASRLSPRLLAAQLSLVAGTVATLIAACVAVKYGQIAGIAAAATVGCLLFTWLNASNSMTRGIVPAFAVLVGGIAFVACVEPRQPLTGMLLLPVAPLATWAVRFGPLAKLPGVVGVASQMLLVVAVLVVGGILVWTGI